MKNCLKQLAYVFIAAVAIFPTTSAMAQVTFGNSVPFSTPAVTAANGHADRYVYDLDNATKLVGTNWVAQLYYTPGSHQSESTLVTVDNQPRRFWMPGTSQSGTWVSMTKTLSNVTAGATATLQVRVWDGATFPTYEQAISAGATTGKSEPFDFTIPNGGIVSPSAYFMEGLQSFTLTAVSSSAPTITSQPSSSNVSVGQATTFTVSATGSGTLSYQWRKDGTNIAGGNSATLTLASTQLADAGIYSVIVSNAFGSVVSSNAQLNVNNPPVITVQPTGGSYQPGDTVTLSVSVTGAAPLTYQWGKDGSPLNGATSSTLSLPNIQPTNAGNYRVAVSNAFGGVWSAWAQVIVASKPFIISQSRSTNVAFGRTASLSVNAGGTQPLYYQWKKDGANVAGAISPTLNVPVTQSTDGGTYSCVISNNYGLVTSSNIVVTPSFTALPSGRYSGLFFETNEIKHQSSGYLSFTMNAKGGFLGNIKVAGGSYVITNRFSPTNNSTTFMVKRGTNSPLQLTMQLKVINSVTQAVGTVWNTNWVASLRANRADRPPGPTVNGTYKCQLLTDGDGILSPTNGGTAKVIVSNNVVSVSGRLSDATLISQSTTLSRDGLWPLYVPLYKGRGSLLGWLTFTNSGTNKEVSGDASWIKTKAYGTHFTQGFTNVITIDTRVPIP